MSVRSHAQQDQIKARKFSGRQSEKLLQSLLVGVRCGGGILVLSGDGKDVGWRNGNLRQKGFFRHAVVAVRIVRGNMAFIAPEKEHLSPRQTRAGVGRNQRVKVFGSRSAGQRNRGASTLRDYVGSGAYDFLCGRLKKILRSGQSTQVERRTHNTPTRLLRDLAAAHRAAPSRPALSLVMTRTGMLSSSGRNLPFSRKACINSGPVSLGRIFGEIPPPRKIRGGGMGL